MLQNEELQAVKTTVLEQQAKALVPFQLDAVNYGDWEPDQREAYLRRLYHVLETLRRGPNGAGAHHRSAPAAMHSRSSVPLRPANIDQLFNINKGHHYPPTSQQSAPLAAHTSPSNLPSGSSAEDNTGSNVQQYGNTTPASADTSAATVANAGAGIQQQYNGGMGVSSGLLPDGSSSGRAASNPSQAGSATTALPRSVQLSDPVREFLAKPVAGPHRPIFFDLETTGMRFSAA
ncbi:hypothetical protein ABBQ32_011394 [Trebouxia sp. C0010 RCD-2024]